MVHSDYVNKTKALIFSCDLTTSTGHNLNKFCVVKGPQTEFSLRKMNELLKHEKIQKKLMYILLSERNQYGDYVW